MLMVGAGGIGCELLKTLALSGFQDIHIVSFFFIILGIQKFLPFILNIIEGFVCVLFLFRALVRVFTHMGLLNFA